MIDKQMLKRIKQLSKGLTEEDVAEFGRIMEAIAEKDKTEEDEKLLPDLFLLFDDAWTSDGIIYPLLHAVESFEVTFYTKTFLKTLKDSYGHAPESMEWLFIGMMNHDLALEVIKENIHLADKETFLALLDFFENDEPLLEYHKQIIAELRVLVNTFSKKTGTGDGGGGKPAPKPEPPKFEAPKVEKPKAVVGDTKEYRVLKKGRVLGDGIEAHHMPSKAYLEKHGIKKGDGIAMNMKKEDHVLTRTYGNRNNAQSNLKSRDELLERIKFLSKGLTEEDVAEFGRIMGVIAEKDKTEEDEKLLPDLFLLFYDDWTSEGIICPLIHAVESFEDSFYVETFLKGLKDFYNNSKECIEGQFYRIMNHNPSLEILKKNVHLADKKTLLALLDNIENDEPLERHKPIITELRALVNT
ncbi:MAG: immunity 30 family protein [Puniceicoccales bacterium]|jgi:hypothetical protein|nr:immunity 30 family protein [Puniceicoccales bacterium]